MKKVILSAFVAAAALFATSCTKDATETQIAATGDASVAFTVNAPALGSRAYGDGKTANKLAVLVYHKEKDGTYKYNEKLSKFDINIPLQTTVTIDKLIKGDTYEFLFWASATDATEFVAETATAANDKLFALTLADGDVKVNYNVGKANNENFDAFFGYVLRKSISAPINETITLRRPFAQINVGTDDLETLKAQYGDTALDIARSSLTVMAYDQFNIKTGKVAGNDAIEIKIESSAIPESQLKVNGKNYTYLSMNYVLVPADKGTTSVNVWIYAINTNVNKNIIKNMQSVPIQRNWRTNLVGSFFSTEAKFDVVIDPVFANDSFDVTDAASLSKVLNHGTWAMVKNDITVDESVNIRSEGDYIEPQMVLENGATISNNATDDTQTIYVGAKAKLSVSGKGTIKGPVATTLKTSAIEVNAGNGSVTIDSKDLIVDGGEGNAQNACVYVNAGKAIIKNGTFQTGLDVNGNQNPCVYIDGGSVDIYGGYFINAVPTQAGASKIGVINVNDKISAKITVYGGKFVGQDLTDQTNPDVKNGNIKIAAGYHQVKAGQVADGRDIYEVVAD